MTSGKYRRIRISGDGFDRARQYGVAACREIHLTKAGYERAFAEKGISWPQATDIAKGFVDDVAAWRPEFVTEIEGIADGSGLSADDVFTINCRTEVLWSAVSAGAPGPKDTPRGECSSFALQPQISLGRGTLVGQNWDWLEVLSDTIVVLEVEREDGPRYVSVVEAGLLAKTTMNSAGLALAITTLVSSLDGTPGGVPFHFLIRAIADQTTVSDVLDMLSSVTRASSGNYVLGSADGEIMNIETGPGGAWNVFPTTADNNCVTHTNHFRHQIDGGVDLAPAQMSDSFLRLGRIDALIADKSSQLTRDDLQQALADHTGYPSSVCCHPDGEDAPADRWQTLAGIIMEPATRALHLAEGNPCQEPWQVCDYSEFLSA
jgi:isopenicillin-N N-acyltransferase like protein